MTLPEVVSEAEWRAARDELMVKEKEATRALDALAAERRRLPMVLVEKDYELVGPDGKVRFTDLFDGRRQLIVYHFMFGPGEDPCTGCSSFTDNVADLTHLRARDTAFVLVSRAPYDEIRAFKERMGWTVPWFSSFGSDFNYDFDVTRDGGEIFALSVFLRDGDSVYRSYVTSSRGVDRLRLDFNLLDLTPYGRQEEWEDSPEGWPQTEAYTWWRKHDEYEAGQVAMSQRDSYPPGVPCWVDNLVPDPGRAMDFYGELLGWEFDGPGPGDYYVAKVRGRDVAGVGQAPPGVSPGWNTYVSVASADDTARAAERVVVEPFDVLPAGRARGPRGSRWRHHRRVGAGGAPGLPAGQRGVGVRDERAPHRATPTRRPASTATCSDGRARQFAPGISLFRLPGYVGGEPAQPVPRDVIAVMAKRRPRPARWSVDFWVTDADELATRAPGLGGSVVVPPFDSIPTRQAVLADPFGAAFSVTTAPGE